MSIGIPYVEAANIGHMGNTSKTIGGRLMLALSEQNPKMSQARLARTVGVSGPTVSGWINGGHGLGGENLINVARVLGVSASWLATGKGDKKPSGSAEAIREEAETDSYDLLDKVLRSLVIGGKRKQRVIDLVRELEEESKEMQRDIQEQIDISRLSHVGTSSKGNKKTG